jgi:tRNA U34 5-methylaminomethyl-2-thiouridine-forming methyltransferase MnmC
LNRKIIITDDGSTTIRIEEWNENYHSRHGAIQEAQHVFIKNGLSLFFNRKSVSVLEIGFGTGLNAFITLLESKKNNLNIDYFGVEAFPVDIEMALKMNYVDELKANDLIDTFELMHTSSWDESIKLEASFSLTKVKKLFSELNYNNQFEIIYFDAFGFTTQPELWTEEIFEIMFMALKPKGVLVTYACRTLIIKAMKNVGFTIEKLEGAPGKREMLRAIKP